MAGIWEAINVLDAAYSNNNEFQPRTLSIAVQDKPGVLNEVWSCMAQQPFAFTLFTPAWLILWHVVSATTAVQQSSSISRFTISHHVHVFQLCCTR